MRKLIDLTGYRFGDLVVLKRDGSDQHGNVLWRCRCERVKKDGTQCGVIKLVRGGDLRKGHNKSCGCGSMKGGASKYNFGDRRTVQLLQSVHSAMISRCHKESDQKYGGYGKRGIKVCEEWRDLNAFGRFCVKHGWKPGVQIHRIDNEGDYCSENVEFLTKDEHRQRHRAKYQFGAETVTRKVASLRLGLTVEDVKRLTCAGRIDQRISEYLAAHQGAMKDGGQPILPPSMSKPAA